MALKRRTLGKSGIEITEIGLGLWAAGGSDWGPKNSFEQIELSLTHEFGCSGHRNLGPNQRIDRTEALSMWTTGAATVMQWPEIGRASCRERV